MTAAISHDTFDSRFERPVRPHARFGIRRGIDRHPMVMFATIITSAFLAMALHPGGRAALASPERPSWSHKAPVQAEPKAPRLRMLAAIDSACEGQSWGTEDAACLQAIARQSGREDARKVRLIASAATGPATTPNVF